MGRPSAASHYGSKWRLRVWRICLGILAGEDFGQAESMETRIAELLANFNLDINNVARRDGERHTQIF